MYQDSDDIADIEVIKKVKQNGNDYRELFKKYYWPIFSKIRFNLKIDSRIDLNEDVKDLTMIAFEKSYEAIIKHEEMLSFKSVLFSNVNHLIIGFNTRKRRFYSITEEYEESQPLYQAVSLDELPSVEAEQNDFLDNVRTIVDKLQEHYRIVADLYYLQDVSQKLISQILHIPISTVEGRIAYSREFIRKRLNPKKPVIKYQGKLTMSEAENEILKMNYHEMPLPDLLKIINKHRKAPIHLETLRSHCHKLGLKHEDPKRMAKAKYVFSDDDISFIKENYQKLTQRQLMNSLNQTRINKLSFDSVGHKIKSLNLKKK